MSTVGVAVDKLDDLDTLIPVLQALGAKHVKYGVLPAHYDIVGQALLDTLALGLGDAFTPALKAAWAEIYGVVSTTMQVRPQLCARAFPSALCLTLRACRSMPQGDHYHSWGKYAAPETEALKAATKASQVSAYDWYATDASVVTTR
jgi:hypothetical protein